jgi:DMSO/TMAO reductase YedYZ heme-binding membrane subunit
MLALAITSTNGWMRRMGKWWKRLHRTVYAAGILVVLHVALLSGGPGIMLGMLMAALITDCTIEVEREEEAPSATEAAVGMEPRMDTEPREGA